MNAALPLSLLLALGACTDGTEPDETDTPTGPTADTGTADTGTADTGTPDTGTPPPASTDVTFVIEGPWESSGLSLHEVDLAAYTPTAGALLASAPVDSATPTITLEAPPSELLQPFPLGGGIEWAVFSALLHSEDDGDGLPEAGEPFRGSSPTFLVYLSAPDGIPLKFSLLGIEAGWNAFELTGGALPSIGDLTAVPMVSHELQTTLRLAGTWKGQADARMAMVPVDLDPPATFLYDAPLTAEWVIEVKGAPPADHTVGKNDDGAPPDAAVEGFVTYLDDDVSGGLTKGDTELDATVCSVDDTEILAAWLPPSDDVAFAVISGGRTGWHALTSPPYDEDGYGYSGPVFLGSDVSDLVVDECGAEDPKKKTKGTPLLP